MHYKERFNKLLTAAQITSTSLEFCSQLSINLVYLVTLVNQLES